MIARNTAPIADPLSAGQGLRARERAALTRFVTSVIVNSSDKRQHRTVDAILTAGRATSAVPSSRGTPRPAPYKLQNPRCPPQRFSSNGFIHRAAARRIKPYSLGFKRKRSMRIALRLAALVAFLLIGGCATNPDVGSLSSSQRAKMASMELIRGGASRPHIVLGLAKGLSCHRNAYQSQLLTEDEALQGVKLQAALLDADAAVNVVCQRHSRADWVNNCWASIVCAGDAIRYSR